MPTSEFKDRKVGLIIAGVFEIIIGLIYLLPMAALMLPDVAQSVPDAAMGIAILASMAVISIWLGVGTVMARRWARALSLLLAWGWLAAGVAILFFNLVAPPMFTGMLQFFVIITLIAGAFVLFYGGKNVKATFEARDPRLRWTDKCPLPVLVLSLSYGLIALSALVGLYADSPIPFFGAVLTGPASKAYYAAQLAVAAYLALGTYHLTRKAWFVSVAMTLFLGISAVVSYTTIDMITLFRAMNVPFDQIAVMRDQGWDTARIALITGVFSVAWLGYLLYVKKYFSGAGLQQSAA